MSACRRHDSPEAEIRTLLKDAEVAAEARDVANLRHLLAEKYADSQGHDKQAIEGVLRYYLLRHQSIHVLTLVRALSLSNPHSAELSLCVALGAERISAWSDIGRFTGDLQRLDLYLMRDEKKDWKVIRAEWRQVGLGECA